MLTNSKIALSAALVLATASAALAAPKHAVRHQTAIERQAPAGAYLSFGSARSAPHSPNPEWDVYRNGRYIGSDPDPLVRLMLLRDAWTQY